MEKGWTTCGHLLSIIMPPKKVVVKSELVKVEHAQLLPQQRRHRIQKTLSEAKRNAAKRLDDWTEKRKSPALKPSEAVMLDAKINSTTSMLVGYHAAIDAFNSRLSVPVIFDAVVRAAGTSVANKIMGTKGLMAMEDLTSDVDHTASTSPSAAASSGAGAGAAAASSSSSL